MSQNEEMLNEYPEAVRRVIRGIWDSLSGEQRRELQQLLDQLPKSTKPLKEILSLLVDQYQPVVGNKRTITIVGPANVGKSTLFNQLLLSGEDQAAVGPIPGTTRTTQETDTGLFTLVDTPGADAVGEVGEHERGIAFAAANAADFLVIVFEASHGIRRYERELFDGLLALEKPYVVVLNKIDLIPKEDQDVVRVSAAANLRLQPAQVVPTVATAGVNLGQVILAIAKFEPGLLAAMGRALPAYRSRLAWQRVVPAAGSAAAVALVPLPLADLLPLLGIQTGLVLSIARIYGYRITLGRAKELIATFGLGLAARTAFQELSKLGGVPGWVLSAVIAAATTTAIGYGTMIWFSTGERPSREFLGRIVNEVGAYLRDQLSGPRGPRPTRGTLRQQIGEALTNLPGHLSRVVGGESPDLPGNDSPP